MIAKTKDIFWINGKRIHMKINQKGLLRDNYTKKNGNEFQ